MWEKGCKKPRACHSCCGGHGHHHSHGCCGGHGHHHSHGCCGGHCHHHSHGCGHHDKCTPLGPFTAVDAHCIPRHTRHGMSA